MYRPFVKRRRYFNRDFNNRVYQLPSLFPTAGHENLVIAVTGTGSTKLFSALMINLLPGLEVISKSQCFPRYWYHRPNLTKSAGLFDAAESPKDSWVREDAITDEALSNYRRHYKDDTITKDGIFYHVYGVLHSSEYREQFEQDLRRMLPRIPYPHDFWAFADGGRRLGKIHCGNESAEPYPLEEVEKTLQVSYKLVKLRFPGADKTRIIYNETLELAGIPPEAN